MTDSEFLMWIVDRLVYKHGESRNVDYMLRLWEITKRVNEMPGGNVPVWDRKEVQH